MWTSPGWWRAYCCSKHGHRTHTEGRPLQPFTQTGVCNILVEFVNAYIQIFVASLTCSTTIIHRGSQETSSKHVAENTAHTSASFWLLSLVFTLHFIHMFSKSRCLFFLPLRFLESLLRQASNALILHCPTMHCFVNQNTDVEPSFRAEEFSDVSGWPQSLIKTIHV